jgi:glycosyltransferase involved in cell wall biosynthesis
MHICYLCHEYPPAPHGGIGSFVQTIGRELVARGHRVTVVGLYAADCARNENDCGVEVIRIPREAPPGLRLIRNRAKVQRKIADIHRQSPVDLIEGAETAFILLSRSMPQPKLIRMHGGHAYLSVTLGHKPRPWNAWQERRSFAVADHLSAVSSFVAENTIRLLNLGSRPVEIIPNPVDVEQFRPSTETAEQPGLIVFVGRMAELKGIRELVAAMPRVFAAAPLARLEVYGKDAPDPRTGESFTAVLKRSIPAEYADRVVFHGAVPRAELPKIMARAAICAYPSHIESHPIAWLEGMAMGKAMLTSNTGPAPEVIEHEKTAITCNPHDPDSIAEGLLRLLNDPALRSRLAAAARASAVERFALPHIIDTNIAYYKRLIGGTPAIATRA